jgi:hypothetical protein
MNLIKSCDSLKTKIAAVYSIYLIGNYDAIINKNHNDHFTDTLARKALVSLINNPELSTTAVALLKRDPWTYDIPFLMDYLGKLNSDYLYILSALRVYQLYFKFMPLWQQLPKYLWSKKLTVYTDSTNQDPAKRAIYEMIALKNELKDKMVIDNEIFESREWKDGLKVFKKQKSEILIETIYLDGDSIKKEKPRIPQLDSFQYSSFIDLDGSTLDYRFIYAFKTPGQNNLESLFIYTPDHARNIILEWWNSLTIEEQQQLTGGMCNCLRQALTDW